MANYRRNSLPGETFFFAVVSYRRRLVFDQPESGQILREVVQEVRQRHRFTLDAWVLLPEHMHCIWTLPKESFDFSVRWNLIKSGFSRRPRCLYHVDQVFIAESLLVRHNFSRSYGKSIEASISSTSSRNVARLTDRHPSGLLSCIAGSFTGCRRQRPSS